MKRKQDLANGIRGWIPNEPKLRKPIHQFVQPSSISQENVTQKSNVTKQRTFALVFVVLSLIIIALLFATDVPFYFKVALQTEIIGILVGLIVGSLISLPLTKRELKLLAQDGKIAYLNAEVLPWGVISLAILLVLQFYGSMEITGLSLTIIFAFILGSRFANFLLCMRWEKSNRKRIYMRSWGRAYAVQK